jgi:hypothetical protein
MLALSTPTRFVLRRAGMLQYTIVVLGIAWIVWAVTHPPYKASAILVATFAAVVALAIIAILRAYARHQFVRYASLPAQLKRKLREEYPQLSPKHCDLVEQGLRQFFLAYLLSHGKFVAMPSKVVDSMWHNFILDTRTYQNWCRIAFGKLLHHTPAEALGASAERNDGLRRVWFHACREEGIDPRNPTRLPLLFALDAKLQIAGGFQYLPDCRDIQRKSEGEHEGGFVYCGTSFSDSSYSGDADGMGGSDGSGGDGAGDGGGGCGGD